MSTTKKVLTIVFSILIIAAFAFVLTWGIINWSKVKDGMSGSGLYTQDDVQSAFEDGYGQALEDKEEYEQLINSYRDTITTQTDLISQYTSEANVLNNSIKDYKEQVDGLTEQKSALEVQVATLNTVKSNNEETIADLNGQIASLASQVLELQANKNENENLIEQLNNQINNLQSLNAQLQSTNELNLQTISGLNNQIIALNSQISELKHQMQENSTNVNELNLKITELQNSVRYYENYIATLEQGDQVVATFEFAGSVYNIQVVNKNSILTVTTPTSTAYVIFNGWTVDGQIVDLASYKITANTRFLADVTYKYEVNFIVEGENYSNQIILRNEKAAEPMAPTKAGYVFDGWTIDGNVVSDIAKYQITQHTTFTAKFTKLYSVLFKYEETTLANKTVKSGEYTTAPDTLSTAYKVFNGWKLNGSIVDVSKYRITTDTVFVADITYKYDVKFTVDGSVYNAQIVEKNAKPSLPDNPSKDKYVFVGWSLDGSNIVDVSKHTVTANVEFVALFRVDKFTVKFNNGTMTVETQQVDNGGYATKPSFDSETFAGWTIDGKNIVNLATYKITQNTTFTAKHGSWTFFNDEMIHTNGVADSNKIEVGVSGLKAGEKVRCMISNINVQDARNYSGGGYNDWDGFTYVGYNGNFEANPEWSEHGMTDIYGYEDIPTPMDKEISSTQDWTTVVGRKDWSENNVMTIKIYCEKDGILTIEWTSTVEFFIAEIHLWQFEALR